MKDRFERANPAPAPAPRTCQAPKPKKKRAKKRMTAAQLKNDTRTRQALYRDRNERGMAWKALEEKYNLRRANGMTAYRVYWDYHKLVEEDYVDLASCLAEAGP